MYSISVYKILSIDKYRVLMIGNLANGIQRIYRNKNSYNIQKKTSNNAKGLYRNRF